MWQHTRFRLMFLTNLDNTQTVKYHEFITSHQANINTTQYSTNCPAMMYWQDRMSARLKEQECDLCDREAITALLNSQNTVDYEEINGLLRNFPLPEPNT